MRYLMKLHIPNEPGNKAVGDPSFGAKMQQALKDVGAEAAYFTTVEGQRGGYIILNIDDASQIPAIAEPFFFWLKASIELIPVMTPEDLAKAGPAIGAAAQKWG
jgi:hypothetical protein